MAVLGLRFCARAFSSCGAGATLHRGTRTSHYRGLSCCRAQAPDAQAQQLWLTGPVAPRHVGSSQTRARTCVPCIGRQTLNHCATREAPSIHFYSYFSNVDMESCVFIEYFILPFGTFITIYFVVQVDVHVAIWERFQCSPPSP